MPNLRNNLSLTSKQRRSVFFSGVLLDKGGKITQDNTDLTVSAFDSKDRAAPDYLRGVFFGNWLLANYYWHRGKLTKFWQGVNVIKGSDWFGSRVNFTHRAFDVVPHLLNDGGLSVKCEVSVMLVIGVCWAGQTLPPINFPPPHQTLQPQSCSTTPFPPFLKQHLQHLFSQNIALPEI